MSTPNNQLPRAAAVGGRLLRRRARPGARRDRDARPARAAERGRLPPLRQARSDRGGDPRHGRARRAGDRHRGRVRAGAAGAAASAATRAASCWRTASRASARPRAADGGEPGVGDRAHGAARSGRRRQLAPAERARAHAGRGGGDPPRGRRGLHDDGPARRRARAGARDDPHALQRGRARDRRLRHGARRDPRRASKRASDMRVLADETRPYLQGARLTAWELRAGRDPRRGDHRLDGGVLLRQAARSTSASSAAIASPRTATSPTRSAPTAWRVLAHAPRRAVHGGGAVEHGRPALPDGRARSRSRSARATRWRGSASASLVADGIQCRHPAFDVTPARFVSAVFTERGEFRPDRGETPHALAAPQAAAGV